MPCSSPTDAAEPLRSRQVDDRADEGLGERTLYDWDTAGRLIKITKPKGAISTTVDDYASEYFYDELDRIKRQADYDTSTADARYVHLCYNIAGDLRSVTSPRTALTSKTGPERDVR